MFDEDNAPTCPVITCIFTHYIRWCNQPPKGYKRTADRRWAAGWGGSGL